MARLLGLNKKVKIIKEIDEASSDGQLRKWYVDIEGEKYYLKGSSIVNGNEMYECESECICSRLAIMVGLDDVVKYDFDILELDDREIKVCISKDFINESEFYTYADLLPGIAHYYGQEKYDMVIKYNPDLKHNIDNILLFDAIINNTDRHLNNLAIVITENGETKIPLFDNGAALFSNLELAHIPMQLTLSFEYQKCKPFFQTTHRQLNLLGETKLNTLDFDEVSSLIDCYLNGERAWHVKCLLKRNLRKLDLLKGSD